MIGIALIMMTNNGCDIEKVSLIVLRLSINSNAETNYVLARSSCPLFWIACQSTQQNHLIDTSCHILSPLLPYGS